MTSQEKKKLILKKISDGDKRSYNEIQADLELQFWNENKFPSMFNRNNTPHNNRKRTNARKIQSVGKKQIKHLQ